MVRIRSPYFIALLAGFAASPAAGQVTLGVRAGASLSDLVVSGVGVNSQDGRRGFASGASLSLPVSGPFALRLEGSYVPKGATFTLVQLGDVGLRLDYVELSALARAGFQIGRSRGSPVPARGPHAGLGDQLRGHDHGGAATDYADGKL